jgi:hypothetical protein
MITTVQSLRGRVRTYSLGSFGGHAGPPASVSSRAALARAEARAKSLGQVKPRAFAALQPGAEIHQASGEVLMSVSFSRPRGAVRVTRLGQGLMVTLPCRSEGVRR